MVETIHDYDKRLARVLRLLEERTTITSNRDLILGFRDECFAQGLSKARVVKYVYYLITLSGWFAAPFRGATKADIKRLVGLIEACHYAESSKKELKICVKKLYKWIEGSEDYPEIVRWIKPHKKGLSRIKMPEELLTENEIERMIRVLPSPRDRAFVAMIYETGCRIGEILFIRIRHVVFDRWGALVRVDGKTGPRRVRIVSSVPYLQNWLNVHPSPRSEAYVWEGRPGHCIGYARTRDIMRRAAAKAGIPKHVHPHLFRHSRATYLAGFLTEAQMKEYFGWVQGSDMASIYVHMSGRDVDKAMLEKVYGVKPEGNETKSRLVPKVCTRCQETNETTNSFCKKCGLPLDEKTRIEIVAQETQRSWADTILDEVIDDPDVRRVLERKLRKMRNAV